MSDSYREIEGVVRRIGDKALWFRPSDATKDVSIPLSAIDTPDAVSEGDNFVRVSKSFLRKLEREGEM